MSQCVWKNKRSMSILIAQMLVEPWITTKWMQGHSLGFEFWGGGYKECADKII